MAIENKEIMRLEMKHCVCPAYKQLREKMAFGYKRGFWEFTGFADIYVASSIREACVIGVVMNLN